MLKQEMQSLTAFLLEYPVVMEIFVVGSVLNLQLVFDIGEVRRRFYPLRKPFAGIDAPPGQSG